MMKPWPKLALDALLLDVQVGFASGVHNSAGSGVPHLRPMNVSRDGQIDRSVVKFVASDLAAVPSRRLRKGDVLFNNTNSPELVGKTALFADDDEPAFSNHMTRLRVDETRLDPAFLALRLHHSWREGWFAAHCNNHVSQASIGRDVLRQFEIELPPLQLQHTICALSKMVDARRSSCDGHLIHGRHALDQFRQAVLAAACSGRLTAGWRAGRPKASADDLIQRLASARLEALGRQAKPAVAIAEADLPEVPESWRWLPVDALARSVVDGVHKTPTYVDRGVPFLTVRNLTAGPGISFDPCKYIREEDHRAFTARAKPQRGDILISKDGTIGVTRAVRTDQEFSIFVSLAMVKPLLYEMSDYLEIALSSPQLQRQMVGVGSGLVHLVLRDLKADAIPVPPLDEQAEIVDCVNRLLTISGQLRGRVESARRLTDRSWQALIAKALRGDLLNESHESSTSSALAVRTT